MKRALVKHFLSISLLLMSGLAMLNAHSLQNDTFQTLIHSLERHSSPDTELSASYQSDYNLFIHATLPNKDTSHLLLDLMEIEEEDERLKAIKKAFVSSYFFSIFIGAQLEDLSLINCKKSFFLYNDSYLGHTKLKYIEFQVFLI